MGDELGELAAVEGEVVRGQAELLDRQRDEEANRDRDREPDGQCVQRSKRQLATLLHQGDAQPAEWPELRTDDHRPDDQDRRVEEDPGRRDQDREHHERDEVARQLDVLGGARLDLLPDRRHPTAFRARTAPRAQQLPRCWVSTYSSEIEPTRGIPSSRRSPRITLASSRATSHRITSPSGRRAALQEDHVRDRTVGAEQLERLLRLVTRRDDPQVDHDARVELRSYGARLAPPS